MDDGRRFSDFTQVVLTRPVEVNGVSMPQGAKGVVMAAYADGLAYEVEFKKPQHAVLTIEGADLKA